ncbi:MAG: T9SS type A sorting domain-containing protein, partial [Bacteroidales bacterium]|nr:T9SS type A sorting domain-containing protein [Bacteroidales bacterium]
NTITGGTVGAYFYNLGPNAVKVKDNAFTSITGASNACAAVAKGKNSNFNGVSYGEEGLEFRCNSFAGNPYALSVIDGNMRKYQGEQGASTGKDYAGNEFDHWGTNSERDFYVDLVIASALDIPQYTYYSHADNAHKIIYYTTSKITNSGNLYNYADEHCAESGGGGGIIIKGLAVDDGIGIIETTDTKILIEEFELTELTDAGNTMSLLNETETMSAENSIAIAEDIAKLEGFISDEVATTYIQNNTGNDFAKANALLKNSPLPSSVQSELNIMEMNPALKSIVKQEQVGTNARDVKLMKIAELKQFRGLVINEMVLSSTNSESTNEEKIAIIQFLENDDNLQSKFHLIDINCKMQNFANAKANLETIRQMIQSEDMQYIAEMEDYIELQSIMIDIESGAIELEDAIENNLELINYIADNEDYPGELTAQLLLAEAGIRNYEELIRLPEPSMINKNTVVEHNPPLIAESLNNIINVYPNPTSANIYVEYAFLNNNNNAHYIEIYGVKGNLIDKIELPQTVGLFTYSKILAAGNYIIKVGENYSQKITVQ